MSSPDITLYSFEQLETTAGPAQAPADVLSAAWAEAEQVREAARREGHEAGYAEGLAAAQAQAAPIVDALCDAIRGIEATREKLIDTLVTQSAELSVAISEHVLSATLDLQPERVIEVARGALRRLADRHRVTLLVNPEDLELLSTELAHLQSELGGIEHLEVQSDRRIGRGGAVARTDYGEIDATITAQLESVQKIVASALLGEGDAADTAVEGPPPAAGDSDTAGDERPAADGNA